MQKYKSNITTTSGAAVRNVPVHVLKEDGAPASLFLDRDGMVPAPNPLTTGADGTFYFYAVNGRYSLRTTVDGVTITDEDVVLLMDVEEIAFAGPIADAVQAAESAAGRAEAAVAGSGITELVSTAQNAVVDANAALISANAAATSADLALTNAVAAKDAADLSASAANTAAANAALAADSASLNYKTAIRAFETYAAANAAVGSLADGSIIEVSQDETRAGARTRYKVQAGALVFVVNLDQVRLDLANATDPTKGAGMIGYDGGTVQTVLDDAKPMADYVALRAYTGRATSVRITLAGLAGGFQRDASDTTSADNGGTIIVDASGRRWHRIFSGVVIDKWFGAVGDMVADDTLAVQKALDYCNSFPIAMTLEMTGLCKITSSLIVNRPTDTRQTDLNIIGNGDSGFYVSNTIAIFDSTIPGTSCSEFITFNQVAFIGQTYGLGASVMTSKFLRIQSINCTFDRILFANFDTTYAQTFRFSNCRIRSWEGVFFHTRGSYDIDFDGNIIEHGGSLFRSVDPSGNTGSLGNRFRGNLIEGLSGIAITQNVTRGLEVSGNYTELNMGPVLALTYDLIPQYGINFSGNMAIVPAAKLADPEFFVVQWGATTTASSSGNYTDGRLHDNKSMSGPLESSGDVAGIAIFRGNGTGITDASRGGAAGTVFGVDTNSKILYVTNGPTWSGIDPRMGAFVTGPTVNNMGTLVPIRIMVGAVNPQQFPASYGNPFWALGSRVFHSNPAIGQPKGWICTGSGRPGTWVEEGTL